MIRTLCFVLLAAMLNAAKIVDKAPEDLAVVVNGAGAAGTAIANVGPGLGDIIGPAGHFGTLPDGAKWFLMIGMLLGRLELIGILVLLSPAFWRG